MTGLLPARIPLCLCCKGGEHVMWCPNHPGYVLDPKQGSRRIHLPPEAGKFEPYYDTIMQFEVWPQWW